MRTSASHTVWSRCEMADLVVALGACEPLRLARRCSGRWRTRRGVGHWCGNPCGGRIGHRRIPRWHSKLRCGGGVLRRKSVGWVGGWWWSVRAWSQVGVRWGQGLGICAERSVGSGHRACPWRVDHAWHSTIGSSVCSRLSSLWTYPICGDARRVVLWARRMTGWGTGRRATVRQLDSGHVIGPRRSHGRRDERCASVRGVKRVMGWRGQRRRLEAV